MLSHESSAQVVKLVYTPDLGSGVARRGGSSPLLGTHIRGPMLVATATASTSPVIPTTYDAPERDLFKTTWHDTCRKIAKFVLCCVIFPYGVFVVAVHLLNPCLISATVLLSQSTEKEEVKDLRNEQLLQNDTESVTLTTADKVKIDGCVFSHTDKATDKWVIFDCMNSETWESSAEECRMIGRLFKANVLCCNHRNVGYSQSKIPLADRDLKRDTAAQVEHLLTQRNISAGNVFLAGHSLGGMIGSQVFTKYHNAGIKLGGLLIDRSPTSLTSVIKNNADCCMNLVARAAIWLSDWSLTIPYQELKKIGHFRTITAPGDKMSPPHSLPKDLGSRLITLVPRDPENPHSHLLSRAPNYSVVQEAVTSLIDEPAYA